MLNILLRRLAGLYIVLSAGSLTQAVAQTRAMEDDQVPISFTRGLTAGSLRSDLAVGTGVLGRRSNGSLLGVDSVVNFSSYFYIPGFRFNNDVPDTFTWQYSIVGRAPFGQGDDGSHGNTWIGAPIVPVNLDLRNFDGSPRFVNGQRLISSVAPYINPVLK